MQRYGRTSSGRQRWRCQICRTSTVRRRPDTTSAAYRHHFVSWLAGTKSLTELAEAGGISRWTLIRRFTPFWENPLRPVVPGSLGGHVLILDGLYLDRRTCVLIARTPKTVVSWEFTAGESTATWSQFLTTLPRPWAIVSDGQKGLLRAIREVWPLVLQQRCLAHVVRLALAKLTRQPKTTAGRALRRLILTLKQVTSKAGRRGWLRRYRRWEARHATFLTERTRGYRPDRKRPWWYTHQRLRSVRHLIRKALPDLFTAADHSTIPRTTNHIEGGLNARLKELLHRHRGWSRTRKQALAACFLASKQ